MSLNIYNPNWTTYYDFLEFDIIEYLENYIEQAIFEYLLLRDIDIQFLD